MKLLKRKEMPLFILLCESQTYRQFKDVFGEKIVNKLFINSIFEVDNMMKFEKVISSAVTGTALEILQAICNACSVELGSNTFIGYDEILYLNSADLTARQVVGYIAEKAGGFCPAPFCCGALSGPDLKQSGHGYFRIFV